MTSLYPITSIDIPLNTSRHPLCTKLHPPIKFSYLKCSKIGALHQNWSNLSKRGCKDRIFSLGYGGNRGYLYTKSHPIRFLHSKCSKIGSLHQNWSNLSEWGCKDRIFLYGHGGHRGGFCWVDEKMVRKERVVKVRFNQGFGFNGGGGGGGKIDGTTARVLGNLALAVGLTYLTMTGQLGWFLDAIVSLWLIAVIVPVLGIGAFLWWAGRDMIIGTCPNCGNAFQVFKSTINDELQLCPFCSQPFSVQGNDFVKEPITFSSERTSPFDQYDDFTRRSRKGKDKSTAIVDVEAEVKDAE